MLLCAKIVNTHGVLGEVNAIIYADSPEFFEGIRELVLGSGRVLHPNLVRPHKDMLIMRFDEIETLDEAERLKGCDLYLKREQAAPLPEGRFYIVDIIGLLALTEEGETLGRVTDVIQTGKNDVYVIKNDDGREYLVPVIDEVVTDIDIPGGKILIKPIKGLFDDED